MPAECHTGVSGPSEEGRSACSGVLYSEREKGGGRMEGERVERSKEEYLTSSLWITIS